MTCVFALTTMPSNSHPSSTENEAQSLLSTSEIRVVLVCDIVESVRWMEHDEDNAITRWSQFAAHVRQHIAPARGGSVAKSTGDGLVMEFANARDAVQAATAMHAQANAGNTGLPPEQQMHLRTGIHEAPIRRDAHDIYGHGVNLAARITTLAGPGEVIVSAPVRDHLTDGLDGEIEDMGECYLKHVKEPQRVYRVGGISPLSTLVSSVEPQDGLARLAVLSFESRLPTNSEWQIGDLVADSISAVLSRAKSLKLISRMSARSDVRDTVRRHQMQQALNANYYVVGSFAALDLNAPKGLLLTVKLLDAADSEIMWMEQFQGAVSDFLSPDSPLAHQIAQTVQHVVLARSAEAVTQCAVPNLASYALHLGAVTMMHRFSKQDFFRARDILQHLMDRNPRWSVPYLWLAKWYMLMVEQGWADDPKKSTSIAQDHANRALDRHANSALAHTINGIVQANLAHDLSSAMVCYEKALEMDYSEPLAWLSKGMVHAFRGEAQQAISDMHHAISLSPLDPQRYYYTSLMASAQLTADDYTQAIYWAKESLRHNSQHASTHRVLTIAQVLSGDEHTARQSAKKLMHLSPSLTVQTYLSRAPAAGFNRAAEFARALGIAGVPST